eukprot:GHVN01028058.1.p1 GENE.GHVN01028058.1~~GHVN01028058.1.p1  ORF type:complete len:129 (+),score=5.81 GHVN01028058.1:2-388(+)
MCKGEASHFVSSQWNVPHNTEVFQAFDVKSRHSHTYSLRAFLTLVRGLAISSSVKIRITSSGVLCISLLTKWGVVLPNCWATIMILCRAESGVKSVIEHLLAPSHGEQGVALTLPHDEGVDINLNLDV